MQRLDRHRRVWAIPFQQPGAPALLGLTYAEAEQAAWAIDPARTLYRGAGAINAALTVALGWSWLLTFYNLPLVRQVQDWVYDWVVRNRSHLPGLTPPCSRPGANCIQPPSD